MGAQLKIVMQVTISAEECPELHRELIGMTAARRRVKRLLALASVGLLVEQGRLAGAAISGRGHAAPPISMSLRPLGQAAAVPLVPPYGAIVGQSIAEMTDAFGEVDAKD
jgi:hypothetical protein